ncbi:unnamed protein product [Effrenium voratum]|nr:unnamed protein product [Effrenium voratum]
MYGVMPGQVEDPTPAHSVAGDLEMGATARDLRERMPMRNVVLTIEQKEKLQQWQQMAEHGFEIHRRAERYYESVNFWTMSLPTVVLSAAASLWTLATEQTQFPQNKVGIASISGLTTVVTSVGSYWRWQARMEKNRFASERYNSLINRLTLLKARLQMGDIDFGQVLQEVESTIHEILKTCGPPDLWVQQRFEWEEKTSQYELLDRLASLRDVSPWVRCFCPCCWQSITKMCARRRRKEGEVEQVEPMSILNQKIREFSKKTQDVSVDEFKDYFWQLFRMASNSNNLEMCKNLVKAVPNSLKDGDVAFKSLEPSKKSPLHYSVQDNFHQLGQWLFETYPDDMKRHCLIQDCHSKIPLDYYIPKKRGVSAPQEGGSAFYPKLLFETFQQWCTEMGDLHSFEDKERMKRIGGQLLEWIKDWGPRHVDVACSKRHTVLHLLAVHGVEEQEVLDLANISSGTGPNGSRNEVPKETGTLLALLVNRERFDPNIKDAGESKAPLELAAEMRHGRAVKLLLEKMLEEMKSIQHNANYQDRFKSLKAVVEQSLTQLHEHLPAAGSASEPEETELRHCCSCAELERIQQRSRRTNALRDFVELKLHVAQANGESAGYEGTLLHYACGAAEGLIDAAALSREAGPCLARRLLEQRAANCADTVGRTPLSWAVKNNLPQIAWDMCEYGIDNDVPDIIEDIEQHLADLPDEYMLFRISQDSSKAIPEGWQSLQLWLEFANGARAYLEGSPGASPDPTKTVLEFRLSRDGVAPIAFKLNSPTMHSDKVRGRSSFTLEGLRLGRGGAKGGASEAPVEEEWVTICASAPLKEWINTSRAKQRKSFMNYDSSCNRHTLWHLACRSRNVRLARVLRQHGAKYTYSGTKKTPLDLAAGEDSDLEDAVDTETRREPVASLSGSLSAEPRKRELAELLVFHDYALKAARCERRSCEIVPQYHTKFDLTPSLLVSMRSTDGKVLLHWAAIYGIYKDVEWLLVQGAKLDVVDQLAFQDFRFTILAPSKQKLEEEYGADNIPFPEFCCQKAPRKPFSTMHSSPMQDIPAWLRQDNVSEVVTLKVCFQRPERFDSFRWPGGGEESPRGSAAPRPPGLSEHYWVMEARRSSDGLPTKEDWMLLNLRVKDLVPTQEDNATYWGGYTQMQTFRTPFDYALEFAPTNSDADRADDRTERTDREERREAQQRGDMQARSMTAELGNSSRMLPAHAQVCKLLIEKALEIEKQEGRRGRLVKQALRSYCRPYLRVRTLSKYMVDIPIQASGRGEDPTTLLHVAAQYSELDVCTELLRLRCSFKEAGGQTPLDVAADEPTYKCLILPAFISLCARIKACRAAQTAQTEEEEDIIAQVIEQVDLDATEWLMSLESRALSLQQIIDIKNPHHEDFSLVDYAAMYGLKRVLRHVVDSIAEIDDDRKIPWRAELIGVDLPRFRNRKALIYDIRSLFASADDQWTASNLKQKLKQIEAQLEENRLTWS